MNYKNYIWILILTLVPLAAKAEVMDKEPSLMCVWGWGLAGIIISFLATYKSKWLGIFILPIILFFADLINEVHDPHAGPAILTEAGNVYVVSAYIAPLLILISAITGFYVRCKKLKKQPAPPVA